MPSRLFTERERPLVRALQTTRTSLFMLFAGFLVILLVQADPHHQFALALFGAIHNWAHAAFPALIK